MIIFLRAAWLTKQSRSEMRAETEGSILRAVHDTCQNTVAISMHITIFSTHLSDFISVNCKQSSHNRYKSEFKFSHRQQFHIIVKPLKYNVINHLVVRFF